MHKGEVWFDARLAAPVPEAMREPVLMVAEDRRSVKLTQRVWVLLLLQQIEDG